MPGFSAFAATEMPAIRPPPPIAITSVSSDGSCSSISSPHVPCPATIASSSYGWTITRSRSAASTMPWAFASSNVSPSSTTSAPKRRVFATLTAGAKRGITITVGMPIRSA